ncbi:MAG: ybfF [Bacteroidota bacterium]|jgi:pimeloyl-ACP methyl ester carboxylesterase|nr:ybfF [Bacteroidota bacterium]
MKLAYREFGQGQPLIILHGLFGQSDNWNTLAKRFGDSGFHVFTPDLRNHGLSPHSEEWNYEVMANDISEFIKDHGILNPVLLGHSMGGKTVIFFEKLFPGIAKKLVVADIAPRAYEPHHELVLKALNAVDFSDINSRKDAEVILSQFIPDFGTKQFLLKNIYWKENETKQMAWRFNLSVISSHYDSIGVAVPAFKSLIPVLFIKGEKSNYINSQDEKDILNYFPNYELEIIPNSGHWVHAEQPEIFFNTVLDFIS